MSTNVKTIEMARALKCCVIIPTYNNARLVQQVINDVLLYVRDVIVVNDGATDDTEQILAANTNICVVSYGRNRGKGYALVQGFRKAASMGFDYAITMDSDGQHLGKDIEAFLVEIARVPGSLIVGSRLLRQENMPGKNTFANKFSNFWFHLHTGINLPDTQSGFRLYPLKTLCGMRVMTSRYEAELEMLVRVAWRGVRVCNVPISVYYPPRDERVTHFRPFHDFTRISIINTVFTILAVFQRPKLLLMRWFSLHNS